MENSGRNIQTPCFLFLITVFSRSALNSSFSFFCRSKCGSVLGGDGQRAKRLLRGHSFYGGCSGHDLEHNPAVRRQPSNDSNANQASNLSFSVANASVTSSPHYALLSTELMSVKHRMQRFLELRDVEFVGSEVRVPKAVEFGPV